MSLPNVTPDHPDVSDRPYRMGVELEIPLRPEGVEPLISTGEKSDDEKYSSIELGHPAGGELTYEHIGDMEYGIEVRTPKDGIHYQDIADWYEHTVQEVEDKFGRDMEPVGLFGESTAGLHTHISPLTEFQARKLYDLSQEPWMHVFAGTTVAEVDREGRCVDFYPVTRAPDSRHLDIDRFDRNHNSCVNKHRKGGTGHYEWRIPEPMLPENFNLVVEFVARFLDDINAAAEWAESLVREGDSRLTSVRRARKIQKDVHSHGNAQTDATALLADIA